LVCTVADYARFVERLLAEPAPAANGLAVSKINRMWESQVKAADGVSWGLGIGVEHTRDGDAFWHWGNNGEVYNCFVVGFPKQRTGVVVMTNSGNGLKACAEIVPVAIGGDHPALRWQKVVR
jgi:CubicO group peptidase (beta-lactamase class C family)